MHNHILELLWLIPALPMAGFLLLALVCGWSHRTVSWIGVGSVAASALTTAVVGLVFLGVLFVQLVRSSMREAAREDRRLDRLEAQRAVEPVETPEADPR